MSSATPVASRSLATIAALTALLSGCGESSEPPRTVFQHDAAGVGAPTERSFAIFATAEGPPFSLASGGGVCGGSLFLADPRQSTVHQINLSDGTRVRALGRSGPGIGALKSPETAIPDCTGNVVYVIDSGGIVVFDMTSGEFIRRRPRAQNAGAARGPGVLEDGFVILPAIRFASMGDFGNSDRALRGSALGYRQHTVQEDDGRAVLELLSEHCRASSPCTRAALDRIRASESGWVGCQGASHEVGVFDNEGHIRRRIDIRSPMFNDDGTAVSLSAPVTRAIEWNQRNSSVMWCGAFNDVIATAHYTFEEGRWSPGVAMTPKVLLNIHHIDGTPLIADLGLRDFPVAKDADSIYVTVYGDNRNSTDMRSLELDTIRILDGGKLNQRIIPTH